jgi:hypothetical protein
MGTQTRDEIHARLFVARLGQSQIVLQFQHERTSVQSIMRG